ncbi:hypothetical protein [Agrobacterium larrymoorei]|nr:hypothetical protein [Agrobacterium larrymoorei]
MTILEFLEATGIKFGVATAGFAGGLLRALSRRSFTWREVVLSPLCGLLAASYLTAPVLHYFYKIGWPLPDDPITTMHAAAFLTGTSAMWISDLALEAIVRWRNGKTPAN